MPDHLREELGKLLDQYDERRRATQEREDKARDADALFVAGFAELRKSVIRPAFEAAAAMLAERGHQARIEEQEFSVDAGAKATEAAIALHIVPSGAPAASREGGPRTLSISTRHYNKMVLVNTGRPLEGSKGTYPLEKIDRHLVEEELIRFVAGVVAG